MRYGNANKTLCRQLYPVFAACMLSFSTGAFSAETPEVSSPPPKTKSASTAVEIEAGVMFGDFAKEDGPFLLKGNIIVPSGQTLRFGPGTEVNVGGKYTTITVFGQLECMGTAQDPVVIQSASENPNPWDWDRIYIRSRQRSTFEHCIIRHSNYGITAENSSVAIKRSVFEQNSLHGLVVINSNVRLENTTFRKGHVCAILLKSGADVTADSVVVTGNQAGIACDARSHFVMNGGAIKDCRYGLAVHDQASVTITAADITKNSTGVVSMVPIPAKMREMVYANRLDVAVVPPAEIQKILKEPEEVKSVALPTTKTEIPTDTTFKAGFAALKEERQATAGLIGNVSVGVDFFFPESQIHPADTIRDTTYHATVTDSVLSISKRDTIYQQNRYPGEQGSDWYDGFMPKLVLFAQGKKGDADININADVNFSTWYDNPLFIRANTAVFTASMMDQNVTFGDFYENISELSISGRKLRGVKYTGSFWDMGRGNKRIDFHLAFGESEKRSDVGEHNEDVFGEVIDTGYSVRQQLSYVAMINLKPTHFLTLTARGLIAHDQDQKSLFADAIQDTAVPDPISASTGSLGASLRLLGGKLELSGELDMGAHDTVSAEKYDDIAWYKPQVIPSLKRVFGVVTSDSSNFAIYGDINGTAAGTDITSSFQFIARDYYSAGNPYLETDRLTLNAGAKREFTDKLSSSLYYNYERTSFSDEYSAKNEQASPTDNNGVNLSTSYTISEKLPAITVDYGFLAQTRDDFSSVAADSNSQPENVAFEYRNLENTVGVEFKQRFENGVDYSLRYNFRGTNDASEYPDIAENDLGDKNEHGIKANFGFRVKKALRSKTTFRIKFANEVKDSASDIDWKLTENIRINIVPRKLTLTLNGDLRLKNSESENSEIANQIDTVNTLQKSVRADLKYIINPKFSVNAAGLFEDYYDETTGSLENYKLKGGALELIYLF